MYVVYLYPRSEYPLFLFYGMVKEKMKKYQSRIIVSRTPNLDRYIKDIRRIPLLSPEEEVALFQKVKKGDPIAFERIIKSNLRFVVEVAKKYKNKFLSTEDLINEGNIGLIEATQRFDETRGFKFISFAVFWIHRMILNAIHEKDKIVRIPSGLIDAQRKWEQSRNKLSHIEMIEISNQMLAYFLDGLEIHTLEKINATVEHVPIDADHNLDTYSFLESFENKNAPVPSSTLEYNESLRYEIKVFLNHKLDDQQRRVAELYYGFTDSFGKNKKSISDIMNLTPERIRQILGKIHKHGLSFLISRNVQGYL